jgi:hypothetical protein
MHYRSLDISARVVAQIEWHQAKTFLLLNFVEEALPGQYDVVWHSNVLHIY